MARMQGVEKSRAGFGTRTVYGVARKQRGKVSEPLAIAAHDNGIIRGMGAFEFVLRHAKLVDAKWMALAGFEASSLVGYPCSMDLGSAVSMANRVREDQMRALPRYTSSEAFSPLRSGSSNTPSK